MLWCNKKALRKLAFSMTLIYSLGIAAPFFVLAAPDADEEPNLSTYEAYGCLSPRPLTYAHRAIINGLSENSILAIASCLENESVEGIEIDARKCKNAIVLHHDETIYIDGEEFKISDLTHEELPTIPTLATILDFYDGSKPLIIDIKGNAKESTAIVYEINAMLENYPHTHNIHLQSRYPKVLRQIKTLNPNYNTVLLICDYKDIKNITNAPAFDTFNIKYSLVNKRVAYLLRRIKKPVILWGTIEKATDCSYALYLLDDLPTVLLTDHSTTLFDNLNSATEMQRLLVQSE